jgi:hypothetical protein
MITTYSYEGRKHVNKKERQVALEFHSGGTPSTILRQLLVDTYTFFEKRKRRL